jgi:branched-chain amino acid transport system substrate-binding protein
MGTLACGLAVSPLAGGSAAVWAQGADVIVGSLQDMSGPLQPFGRSKDSILRYGIAEVNAAGGLLGRKLKLMGYDTQSNNQLYAQFGQQLALRDKAAVVFGGVTSAAREVVRPVLRRANTPYFYNMPYEGGVCDRNTFLTGVTPSHALRSLVPYLIKKYGKKLYVLGADYNFGQLSAKWIRRIAAEHGGEVVGVELFPMDAANFNTTIAKIQAAAPNAIINSFVGPAHGSFYGQWAASGMKDKIAMASQTFGDVGEHQLMPKEVTSGILVCTNYFEELDLPANKAFLKSYREAGHKDYVSNTTMDDYVGFRLWVEAVRKAGSLDRGAVLKALEAGLAVDTPLGKVAMDGATHHCRYDMYLAEVRDGGYRVIEKAAAVAATDMVGQCDLLKNPNTNQQFEPKI